MLTLEGIADAVGVSPFHLTRAFGAVAGMPLMSYLRARRLSEAARALAGGTPDILGLALQAGYASHEAFTRAFRDRFGLTPEALRARASLANLDLMEPIAMDDTGFDTIDPPRFEETGPLLIAGLAERYDDATCAGIPAQWQRFGPQIGRIPARKAGTTFGVCCNSDDEGNIDYLSGVEVGDFAALPADFARVRLARQRYAVFGHRGHVSEIRRVWRTVWNVGLPRCGALALDAPSFERYGPGFDPLAGRGGFEIWIPVRGD